MSVPPDVFLKSCDALGFELASDLIEGLGDYLDRLLDANTRFNLTAIKEPDAAWMRHILDSLSLLPFLNEDDRHAVDVGSGGGLPGFPLALARPDITFTLLEATGKKANFLKETASAMALTNIKVVNDRAETVGQHPDHRGRYDLAIARAVGPMNVLLEFTLPLVRVGGRVLAMKGRQAEVELRDAGDAIMILGGGDLHAVEALPEIEPDATIIEVIKDHATPDEYPRRPGLPKQEPL